MPDYNVFFCKLGLGLILEFSKKQVHVYAIQPYMTIKNILWT